jgi:hypothetical protein
MSKVKYRGVEYDSDEAKKEYEQWYISTHNATKWNRYRGVPYRPCHNKEVAE